MRIPMFIVDAFAERPFSGNPAAVCLVGPGQVLSDEMMQKLGVEMNLSETVFVLLQEGSFETAHRFAIRWFTPTTEVNLCGHATLASAAVLFFNKGNQNRKVCFESRSGELYVQRDDIGRLSMDFPANPPSTRDPEEFKALLEVCVPDLSLIDSVHLCNTTKKLLVRLVDSFTRSELETLKPQIGEMITCENSGKVKGVGLTVKGCKDNGCISADGGTYDFISRYFAPWNGISEDPVTGSWHTVAACYWSQQLEKKNLFARQCSSRGGDLWVEVTGERVVISGKAVINLEGVFTLES